MKSYRNMDAEEAQGSRVGGRDRWWTAQARKAHRWGGGGAGCTAPAPG